jgi:5'-methylthioadenosine phosphorylase
MPDALGILGGSGLQDLDGFRPTRSHRVTTPFGRPSDAIVEGRLQGRTVFFLPRHGVGHRLLPSEINYRANIWALKRLGVRSLVSVGAVGSLQKRLAPGHFVLVDQLVDKTKGLREGTFFGRGAVGHVSMADPVCRTLGARVRDAARALPITLHDEGTYVCMEGPGFSTRAESRANHEAGHSVIGMTSVPEAYLAREAGLCYCSVAMVTDYDGWRAREQAVSAAAAMTVLRRNVAHAKALLSRTIAAFEDAPDCGCRQANKLAVVTDPKRIPARTKAALRVVLEA